MENDTVSDDDITVVEQGYYGNEKLSNYYALKSINIIKQKNESKINAKPNRIWNPTLILPKNTQKTKFICP